MDLPVTVVTADAEAADQLSEQDYRDIYTEVRARMTLRAMIELVGSRYSPGWWSKYEHGEATLTRIARNELRRAVSLPQLPPTLAEVIARADPDATVYQVGPEPARRIILVGQAGPVSLHLNGSLRATDDQTYDTVLPRLQRPQRHAARKSIHLPIKTWERLSEARRAANLTWPDFLESCILRDAEDHR